MTKLWKSSILLLCLTVFVTGHFGFSDTAPTEGLRESETGIHAFINARIVTKPGETLEQGILVIRDGVIQEVGTEVSIPADARIWNCSGATLYAGLIESCMEHNVKESGGESSEGRYWNEYVRPEHRITDVFDPNDESLKQLRELGFTAAHIAPDRGIFRGTSALITLAEGSLRERLLRDEVAQIVAFDSSRMRDRYPSSLGGTIALIRQTLLDAQWYQQAQAAYDRNPAQEAPEQNLSLQALRPLLTQEIPLLMLAEDERAYLRAGNIAEEFHLKLWNTGNGYEYQKLEIYQDAATPLLLPLNFPKKPVVKTYLDTLDLTLPALRHWERAPANAGTLEQKKIPFLLSTMRLEKVSDFPERIRQAKKHGLTDETILTSLTTRAAELLGVSHLLGTLESGKRAHFVMTNGNLFDENTKVLEVWIDGERHLINPKPKVDPRGTWAFNMPLAASGPVSATLEISGDLPGVSGRIITGASEMKVEWIELDHEQLALNLDGEHWGLDGIVQFRGIVGDIEIQGYARSPEGESALWTATALKPHVKEDDSGEDVGETVDFVSRLVYPNSPYGMEQIPEQPEHVFINNAMIWTSGPQGILENGDLLITSGRITDVGKDLTPPDGAVIIDGTGKHVTPGLIDCHSHIVIESGNVNEVGQAVTAEVRMGDIINNSDRSIYQQLAGGLTMSHLLHGSANPIGGQSVLIKLRWGMLPEEMKETRAPGTIKFALGENVTRANWNDPSHRYPGTRMGVRELIRDRFLAALDYENKWKAYRQADNREELVPPRRDLELETLLEIIHKERWIHCHSYRQDEILMLMRLMESFHVRVGTFQHILEGYKVAKEMVGHGANGSGFSDWWAYKVEVIDAIPFAGALMHNQGVLVSFNSDDAELARRMNHEAAKAVKYGGISEEDALKFVTLNPAKQLNIDRYVGSLEPGKDADFVVWSGSPLSTYSRCEQTWIDGRKYFDLEEDRKLRQAMEVEHNALVHKLMRREKKSEKKENDTRQDTVTEWTEVDQRYWYETMEYSDQRGLCGCSFEEHQYHEDE